MSAVRYDRSELQRPLGHMRQLGPTSRDPTGITSLAEFNRAKEYIGSVLSVIVPAKNEAESLPPLVAEISQALRSLCHSPSGLDDFEIIIVDDGSTDTTQLVLADLAADYIELRWLVLATQVGQSAAIVAGIRAARGSWIATLDADLQNDPADLIRLWNALPGNDAVLGWRVKRKDGWAKRTISVWANWLRNIVLEQSVLDTGCSVRIFSREMALQLPTFYGMHRFIGSLLLREGCRLVQVPVHHRLRSYGKSHYTLWNRSVQVLMDLLGVAWLMRRTMRYRVIASNEVSKTITEIACDPANMAKLPRFFARQYREA
jgi:dolichol-phosphate mannosyltransferase